MSVDDRIAKYKGCMEEIKSRIAEIDRILIDWRSNRPAELFECEAAALQLRKVYELIAFASLSADLEKYKKAKQSFKKEWNFAEITKRLSLLNSEFLPKPMRRVRSDHEGIDWHMEERENAQLDRSDLLKRHGYLGDTLHATIPFGKSFEPTEYMRKIDTWTREVVQLLDQHRYVTGPGHDGFIVEMNGLGEDVTALRYQASGSN